MARIIEIEIGCCGECPYYSMKKHKCQRGAADEGDPREHFFRDCPLPWHEISENDMDGGDNIMNTNPECFTPEGNNPYPLWCGVRTANTGEHERLTDMVSAAYGERALRKILFAALV